MIIVMKVGCTQNLTGKWFRSGNNLQTIMPRGVGLKLRFKILVGKAGVYNGQMNLYLLIHEIFRRGKKLFFL